MKKVAIAIFVFAGLGAAVWFGLPAYRAFKERRFAEQAQVALAAHEPRRALLSAQQALVLNGSNLVAARVMADLAEMTRSPGAIVWRRRVAEIDPTVENRLLLAACALKFESAPFALATETLNGLGSSAEQVVAYHLVQTQLAVKQGRMADARKHLERAIQLEPTNGLHRLNLAVVQLESEDVAVSAKARAELERLQSDARWGANALRALVAHHLARRQFAEAERYSAVLLGGANALFADRLQHLAILHGARSPNLDALLARVQREAATNVLHAADVVARMTALGRPAEALAWARSLPAERQREMPLPVTLAEAHAAQRDWRGLEMFLAGQQWRERDFLRQALLAHAVRQQKAEEVAAAHWRDAVQLASERPELLLMLAQLALGWNWTNETEAVLWRAARDFPRERWPVDSLQRSYLRLGSTRGLFEVNTLLLERDPTNAVVQNNWAALALLLQTNVAKAHQLARQVYDRDPNHYGFVSTHAWSLHVQGRTAEGLRLMQTLSPERLEDPSVAGYYGVMLAAAGQTEQAARYLAKADAARLLPEEIQLVAAARKR